MKRLVVILFIAALPLLARAAGNETINVLPDSNKSSFRVDSQNFWKNELPMVLGRYVNEDFVISGNIHGPSASCTSSPVSFEGFTKSGNRVTANAVAMNYGAPSIGGNCSNDVCWVVGSPSGATTIPGSNFQRVSASTIYINCASDAPPPWPEDSVKLMKVTLSGGAIANVEDIRQPSSFARNGTYDIRDPLYGGICDGSTDTGPAIQQVLDSAPIGAKVTLPGGSCITSQTLHITRSLTFEGAGLDQTYIKQSVPDIPTLVVSYSNVNVQDMTVMHLSNPVTGGDGLVVREPIGWSLNSVNIYRVSASWNARGFVLGCMAYAQMAHVMAQKNNSHGFEFVYEAAPGCGVDQWDIIHANSTLNMGAGFFGNNTVYPFGLGPWLTQTVTFGNNQGGYVFLGSPGNPINDLRFHNNLSSADNVAGIYLDTYGGSHIISNPWIEYTGSLAGFPIGFNNTTSVKSNSGHCLGVSIHNGATSIVGGLYWNCSWSGIAVDAPYATIMGGKSLGNGQALDPDLARRAGVHLGASGIHLSGHSFTFPGATTLYYIHLSGAMNDLSIGINTYSPDLSVTNFVADQATVTGARLPALVTGASVHTNTGAAPGLQLYDATQGPDPLKVFRVTQGQLEILNSAGSAVLHRLSNTGTPAWPQRRGQAIVSDINPSVNIPLTVSEPDALYFVHITPVNSAGSPATDAFVVTTINKFTTGFEVIMKAAPGSGKSVTFDWLMYR
jgi:hypothetical protein